MPDHTSDRLGFAPEPDALETRLDALGRALVEAESRRAEPPRAYLDAAADRALFARARVWTPRLLAAAVLAIAGIVALIMSNPAATTPPGGTTTPLANRTGAAPGAETDSPTVANLATANRDVASPDQLQLLSGTTTPSPIDTGNTPYRASDTRNPDRIDAIIGGK